MKGFFDIVCIDIESKVRKVLIEFLKTVIIHLWRLRMIDRGPDETEQSGMS